MAVFWVKEIFFVGTVAIIVCGDVAFYYRRGNVSFLFFIFAFSVSKVLGAFADGRNDAVLDVENTFGLKLFDRNDLVLRAVGKLECEGKGERWSIDRR